MKVFRLQHLVLLIFTTRSNPGVCWIAWRAQHPPPFNAGGGFGKNNMAPHTVAHEHFFVCSEFYDDVSLHAVMLDGEISKYREMAKGPPVALELNVPPVVL